MYANDRSVAEEERGLPGSRRAQIVRAAAELFAAKGYHGASMDDIGKRVGMLKGSLYAHISRKEEILLEIASTAAREFSAALGPVVRAEAPAAEMLHWALREHLRAARELGALALVFAGETRHLDGQPAAWIAESQRRYERLWRGIFEQGVQAGAFRQTLDPVLATDLALAALTWIQPRLRDPTVDIDQLATDLCALLLEGCRTRGAPDLLTPSVSFATIRDG